MIGPVGATSFSQAIQMGCEVYHNLKAVIKKKYGQDACNVGDEGGFAPNIQENDEVRHRPKTAASDARVPASCSEWASLLHECIHLALSLHAPKSIGCITAFLGRLLSKVTEGAITAGLGLRCHRHLPLREKRCEEGPFQLAVHRQMCT